MVEQPSSNSASGYGEKASTSSHYVFRQAEPVPRTPLVLTTAIYHWYSSLGNEEYY
jgi:hypothetical protein